MPILTAQITPAGAIVEGHVHVSLPRLRVLQQSGASVPPPVVIRALLDTGASCCCVDPEIVQTLDLPLVGWIPIITPSTGTVPLQCPQYDASLWLQSGAGALPLRLILPVVATPLAHQGFDVIVGRDVLNNCLMIYHGPEKMMTLTL